MTKVESSTPGAPGGAQRPVYELVVESATATRRVPLDRPRVVIGRADDCDVVLPDPTVSRRHLVIELDEGLVRFRDLGGTNRAILDGQPTAQGLFPAGSVLIIGMTRVRLDVTVPQDGGRALADADRTSVVIRPRPTGASSAERPTQLSVTLAALRRPPLEGPDFVTELAQHLLESALALTGRTRGAVVLATEDAPLRVVTSVPSDPTIFTLPAQTREIASAPLCVGPWPEGTAEDERLVVPLRPHPSAILILGAPRADGPPSDVALETAAVFAEVAGVDLVDAEHRHALVRELERLRFARSYASRAVAASSRLQGLRRRISETADQGFALLLTGEEGSETHELAQFYHAHVQGSAGPFIACYARLLPANRVAQEFGAESQIQEGAGTCDLRARGGTLFVDSPEVLSEALQVRLGQVLAANRTAPEEQRFRVVISLVQEEEDKERPTLAKELEEQLDDFVTAAIPPLRGFPQDVAALNEVTLDELGPNADGARRRISEDAERVLLAYHWPGNARQHCRALETAAALAGTEPILPRHLPQEVREPVTGNLQLPSLREVERQCILRMLTLCGQNKARTARRLGISTSTLHEKLAKYRMEE